MAPAKPAIAPSGALLPAPLLELEDDAALAALVALVEAPVSEASAELTPLPVIPAWLKMLLTAVFVSAADKAEENEEPVVMAERDESSDERALPVVMELAERALLTWDSIEEESTPVISGALAEVDAGEDGT